MMAALTIGAAGCASTGQSAGGVARLEQARAARPNDAAVARSLGIAYYKQGKFTEARPLLDQAVKLNPRDATGALYLGMNAEQQKDLPAARAAYQGYLRVGRTSRVRRQIEARLAAITRQELQLAAKASIAREQQLGSQQGNPRTVAVMPLRFVGRDSSLQPLERGLAELITTDLARSSQLTVVERARLQAIVDEIALQRSGQTDSTTNVRAGRIIQAGRIVSGQIVQNEARLRVDAAIINTQTSAVAGGAANENTLEQLFTIERNIVLQLFDSLGVRLTTAERNAIEQRPTRSMQAFLAYSQGLQFEDRGQFDAALSAYQNAVRIDPAFSQALQRSAQVQQVSAGMQMTTTTIEAGLAGTTEGNIANMSAQGQAPSGTGGGDNSAQNTANGVNESTAGGATAGAGGGSAAPPPKDPVSAGVGAESSTRLVNIRIVVPIP
jgi:cytochrome c-type biogenesis protein CcmH/NrfG